MSSRTSAGRGTHRTSHRGAAAPAKPTAGAAGAAERLPSFLPLPVDPANGFNRLATAVSEWLPANLSDLPISERWRATGAAVRAHYEARRERRELRDERTGIAGDAGRLFDPSAGASRHLDNTHQQSFTVEGAQRRQDARRQAFALRNVVREMTHNPRLSRCGRAVIRKGGVSIVDGASPGSARFDGVMSCGRVWLCPVCSSRIARLRAAEVMHAIREHTAAGGAVYFQTFTVAHGYGDSLAHLQMTVADAFRQLQQGKSWTLARRRFGVVGTIRALEVTHGAAGWHPHLHVVWLLERPLPREIRRRMQLWTFRTWRRGVVQLAGDRATPRLGLCPLESVRRESDVAAYVAKFGAPLDDSRPALSAAMELTNGRGKLARRGNRTVWEIVTDYARARAERDRMLWQEYEAAMHGRKALTWTRGLKARYGIIELTDGQLLTREDATAPVRARVPLDEWGAMSRRPSLQLRVLELVEAGQADRLPRLWRRLRRWCASSRRLSWVPPSDLEVPPPD